MKHLNRFLALSAVYFGLASAVGAQSAPPAGSGQSATGTTTESRQKEFQHPMLERRSSTDLRPTTDEPRIQRRGMQDMRRDGEMRRNVLPGAADAEGAAPGSDPLHPRNKPATPRSPDGS